MSGAWQLNVCLFVLVCCTLLKHRSQSMCFAHLQDDDKEVVARGTHDCWVVARCRSGQELYLVMEGKGEVGLAGASKLASNFTDNHFPAVF